jgi:hypothetical protein
MRIDLFGREQRPQLRLAFHQDFCIAAIGGKVSRFVDLDRSGWLAHELVGAGEGAHPLVWNWSKSEPANSEGAP